MDSPALVAIVIGAVLALAAVSAFLLTKRHPENASRHTVDGDRTADATGRGMSPGPVRERPAGPGAEGQAVEGRGTIGTGAPGPSSGQPPAGRRHGDQDRGR